MRKLASIRTIKEIKPIENADALELAVVDGWNCVVKKGEFKVNDKGVYFEIDSFLPLGTYFDFLAKSGTKKMGVDGTSIEGIRIKTIRLRGQLSQGLMLPLSHFGNLFSNGIEVNTEVTDILNVKKYEIPENASLSGNQLGHFPSFIKKTDQERLQNLYDKYSEKYKDVDFEVTLKLDGSSMTVFSIDTEKYHSKGIEKQKEKFPGIDIKRYGGICSRNFELAETENNTFWKVAIKENLFFKLHDFCTKNNRNLALQGELMGPGIQGNKEKFSTHKFFVFDIWDIDKQMHLTSNERIEICKSLELEHTPVIGNIKVFQEFKTLDDFLNSAEGKSINANIREGLVFKSTDSINGEIISFKVIANNFLLKEK